MRISCANHCIKSHAELLSDVRFLPGNCSSRGLRPVLYSRGTSEDEGCTAGATIGQAKDLGAIPAHPRILPREYNSGFRHTSELHQLYVDRFSLSKAIRNLIFVRIYYCARTAINIT